MAVMQKVLTVIDQLTNRWTLLLSDSIWALMMLCILGGITSFYFEMPDVTGKFSFYPASVATFFILLLLKTLEVALLIVEELTKKLRWSYYVILAAVVSRHA